MAYDDVRLDIQIFPRIASVALIKYIPRSHTSESNLILDFKKARSRALWKVRDLALEALRNYSLVAEFRSGYLVALPSHTKMKANRSCEYLCAELAKAFPSQLAHLSQVLQRVQTVEKSATAPAGSRPDYAEHYNSIVYAGPQLHPEDRIIMVDDVLTRGATSSACRDILIQATSCKDVRGFFVAKTTTL